jgi:hypothetical protein
MELSIDPYGDCISGYTVLCVTDMECVPRPPVSFETFIVQGCSEYQGSTPVRPRRYLGGY